jgi:hypothetical protein
MQEYPGGVLIIQGFENFIAVMIQPDHYHAFLPFIEKSL